MKTERNPEINREQVDKQINRGVYGFIGCGLGLIVTGIASCVAFKYNLIAEKEALASVVLGGGALALGTITSGIYFFNGLQKAVENDYL